MGDMYLKSTSSWPNASPAFRASEFAQRMFQQCRQLEKPKVIVNLEQFEAISERFPGRFGTDTRRVKTQPAHRKELIKYQIASAYPIIHERTLLLYINFLEHKLKFGSEQEKNIYKDMSLVDFVQRLLAKRCVSFFSNNDYYCTMEGKTGYEGIEAVGTPTEKYPLQLTSVLSYDEIKLAALLYVSTHSEFINDWRRSIGVIIGLIGARFERPDVMEHQDTMITEKQNTRAKGYGGGGGNSSFSGPAADLRRIWREFYEEPRDFLYKNVPENDERFKKVDDGFLDQQVMRKRYAIIFDTLLLEAQARAVAANKPAYIHVVGFGLGVWMVSDWQEQTFLEAFDERLLALGEKLSHIGVVHFAWFFLPRVGRLYDGAMLPLKNHPQGGIKIHNSAHSLADKLPVDMMPVVTYASGGNGLPGNEFWAGALVGAGDPAAACSTLVTELQHPHINVHYMRGANLHITSVEHGLLHIGEYTRRLDA